MVQRTQQLCVLLYLFILSVIWGNEPWNAINEIAVLNHINWCLHSCHSCHKCISRLMSTRRAISQPLLWRASCAFISVYNRARSWLSSLTVLFSSKDKVKEKWLLQEERAGLGRGARQVPLLGENRVSARREDIPSSVGGYSTWKVKQLPAVPCCQVALLSLELPASVCIIPQLLFPVMGMYAVPATASVAQGTPDVLRGLAGGGWPRSASLKWHNAKSLQSLRIPNIPVARRGIKGWERLKDTSSLSSRHTSWTLPVLYAVSPLIAVLSRRI